MNVMKAGVISLATRQKVVKKLRAYTRRIADRTPWKSNTTKMRPHTANALLLGIMLDLNVPWQWAWDAADWMCLSIGDSEEVSSIWEALKSMNAARLRGFLRYGYGGKAFHRYWKKFARLLPKAAEHILENYDGDPRKIWNNQRDVNEVRDRLDSIPSIGPGLARMGVLILARDNGLLGGKTARRQLDPKPDVHVRRVFERTGLVERGAPPSAIIRAARELAPDFPASLDAPAWDIGRNWCRPSKPKCHECPLTKICRKMGISH